MSTSPEQPAPDLARALEFALGSDETAHASIGPYKLLEKIGEGGFGVVWMAEQTEPVRRRVALKIVKAGMDTRELIARFEAERQALALMDHPNIAKIFDAGATDTGRPYFVMELVRGVPITRYCDANRLSPEARLALFISVCQAVQHAHQKGVIHRDLKPSNVLVTLHDGVPVPKIIDFGIAKVIGGARLTDKTLFTRFHQFLGTPVYTSPEQIEMSGLDVDTRSDVYSLGVLLYELLTGRPPFDAAELTKAGLDAARRTILEVDPPRPSQRLGTLPDGTRDTVAQERATDAGKLAVLLRGDLDWIVMRCLEKARTRRYESASGVAADIERYLRHEPVVARPPSTAYLLRKLIRRHRVGFAATALVALAVIGGAIVSTWQAVRATRAEQLAAAGRTNAENLLTFVFTDLAEQLADTGQIAVLRQVSDEALAYYERLPRVLQTPESRSGHAFALAGAGALGWTVGNSATGDTFHDSATRERVDRAAGMLAELETSRELTPFMRFALSGVCSALSGRAFEAQDRDGVVRESRRAEVLLTPLLQDQQWGGWAHRLLANIVGQKAFHLLAIGSRVDSVPEFRRAIAFADEADRRKPAPRRPGLRQAQFSVALADALASTGPMSAVYEASAGVEERLKRFLDAEPFLVTARRSLTLCLIRRAHEAGMNWRFDEELAGLREIDAEFNALRKFDQFNWVDRELHARRWGYRSVSIYAHAWHRRDFAAAEAAAKKALEIVSERAPLRARHYFQHFRVYGAKVSAAAGRDAEVNRLVRELEVLRDEVPNGWSARQHREFEAWHNEGRRIIELERLDWRYVRESAERTLVWLTQPDVSVIHERARALMAKLANHALMRAAFESGDYATAARAFQHWVIAERGEPFPEQPRSPNLGGPIAFRFGRLAEVLTQVHIHARGGELARARATLEGWWPEVEAVHAAAPDVVINQVQTARAYAIRAEIAALSEVEQRALLERAREWLRAAASAGKLTRYEREVLLARIEQQLRAL